MALPAIVGGVLIHIAGSIVARVLVALGISFVSFVGFTAAIDYLKDLINSSLAGMPADIVAILALCKVGLCISIYAAALTANLVMNGLNAGVFKRMIWG